MLKGDNKPDYDDIGDLINDNSPDINEVSHNKVKWFFIFAGIILLIGLCVSHAVSVDSISLNSTSYYNMTTGNLTCNYQTSNSYYSFVTWYKDNQPELLLYIPFENNKSIDYSDYNRTIIETGTGIKLWNNVTGISNSGSYKINYQAINRAQAFRVSNTKGLSFNYNDGFSISLWINRTDACSSPDWENNEVLFAMYNGSNDFWIGCSGTGSPTPNIIRGFANIGTTNYDDFIGNLTLNDGKYHLISFVFDKTDNYFKLYGDGVLLNSTFVNSANFTSLYNVTNLCIGSYVSGSETCDGYEFNGTIDDFKIYNKSMSQLEILQEYNKRTDIKISSALTANSVYQCKVKTFNRTSESVFAVSNNVYVIAYYNNAVTINYPVNNFHYYNFNGNITFANTKFAACQINDTRFYNSTSKTNVLSGVFTNSTIGTTNQKINLKINCTDEIGSVSNAYVSFTLDNTIPFINFITPTETAYTSNNSIYAKINFFDTYLYVSNITMHNSTGHAYYYNETYYNGTGITNTNKTLILPLNYEGVNYIEACVADSNSDSPDISKDTIFNVITNAEITAIKDKDVKADYDTKYNNLRYFDRNNVVIVRNVYVTDKSGNKRLLDDLKFQALDMYIDGGEHIKSAWTFDKTLMAFDDILHINYQCIKGCSNLKLFTDYDKNRIIDDTFSLMFHFKDLEKDYDLSYSYDKISRIMSVSAKLKSKEIFDSYSKEFTADPITAGLSSNCKNISIIKDTINPILNFVNPTDSDYSVINRNYIMINLSYSDLYFDYAEIKIYNDTNVLISVNNTYFNYSINDGVYYFNATAFDYADNKNQTEFRKVTIDTLNPLISINPESALLNTTDLFIYVSADVSDFTLNNSQILLYDISGLYANITYGDTQNIYYNFTELPDGNYYYKIVSCDILNQCSESDNIWIGVHGSYPYVNIYNMPLGTTSNPNINGLFSAYDTMLLNVSAILYNSGNFSVSNFTRQTQTCENVSGNITESCVISLYNESESCYDGNGFYEINDLDFENINDGDLSTYTNNPASTNYLHFLNIDSGVISGYVSVIDTNGYHEYNLSNNVITYINNYNKYVLYTDAHFTYFCSYSYGELWSCINDVNEFYSGSNIINETYLTLFYESESESESCNTSSYTTLNTSLNAVLSEQGLYNYTGFAYDSYGHYNETKGYFYLDLESPYISVTNNSESGILINESVYFEFNVSDINYNYTKLYVYNSSWALIENQLSYEQGIINFTGLYDSGMQYHYYANAYDIVGFSSQSETKDFLIDTDTPSLFIVSPINQSIIHELNIPFVYVVTTYTYKNVTISLLKDGVLFLSDYDNTSQNGSITLNNIPQGNFSFNMTACSYNGLCAESDNVYFTNSYTLFEDAFTTINELTQSESIFLGVLFFAYISIIIIGCFFRNPAFITLGYVIGILIGLFLIRVNLILGLAFIITNLISMAFTLFKH